MSYLACWRIAGKAISDVAGDCVMSYSGARQAQRGILSCGRVVV
jgi:hypothetical protein